MANIDNSNNPYSSVPIPLQRTYDSSPESNIPYKSEESESFLLDNQRSDNSKRNNKEYKNIHELLNTYNLYKRHSLRESIQFIKQNLVKELSDKETHNNEDSYYGVNGVSRKRLISKEFSSDSKAFDIVKKAVALLKTVNRLTAYNSAELPLEKRHLLKALNRKEIFVTDDNDSDNKNVNDAIKQEQTTETYQNKQRREEVPIETAHIASSTPTDNSHQGREEVAVPIYSTSKKDEESIIETAEKKG